MKAYLEQLLQDRPDPVTDRNRVREYLQARILEGLQRAGAMIPLAFHGGTALRFLFGIPRYSEDLDFALENPDSGYNFRGYLSALQEEFAREGYQVGIKLNDNKTVHSAIIRFNELLFEFGLSSQRGQVLAVKIEVDTRPPASAGLDITLVRRHVTLRLQHHNRASLLAGKLHAVYQRPYAKGRDIYDLFWYLSDPDWPEPNFQLLQSALGQTGWQGPALNRENWREPLCRRLRNLDWKNVRSDVKPFLEQPHEVDLLTQENFERLLGCAGMG